MDDELKEAAEFAKLIGATNITYETPNGKISVTFPPPVPEVGFAIPENYRETTPSTEEADEALLFYSSGG